jgi:hypothetical protein
MLSEQYPARDHARKVAGELYKLLPESDRSKVGNGFRVPVGCIAER